MWILVSYVRNQRHITANRFEYYNIIIKGKKKQREKRNEKKKTLVFITYFCRFKSSVFQNLFFENRPFCDVTKGTRTASELLKNKFRKQFCCVPVDRWSSKSECSAQYVTNTMVYVLSQFSFTI